MVNRYALYTKPHKEYYVSSLLEGKGLEAYLSTVQVRKNGRTKSEPFFSCHLLARFDPADSFPEIRWTPGPRRILNFGGRLAQVSDVVISSIPRPLAEMGELRHQAPRANRLTEWGSKWSLPGMSTRFSINPSPGTTRLGSWWSS